MRARIPPLAALLLAGCAESPSYMRAAGPVAAREAALGWILTIIASLVVVVVTGILLVGIFRHGGSEQVERTGGGKGLRWILIGGVVVPVLILVPVFVYSTVVLGALTHPDPRPALTVRVTGHRWWWELRYLNDEPGRELVTANEVHVPVGVPVRLELESADVIHSFWVPELAGKTDLIPGNANQMWIQADRPGVFVGRCAEYCGLQHAHMEFRVIAQDTAAFARWYQAQLAPAQPPQEHDDTIGQRVFLRSACVTCHTIRGTAAGGTVGPDLTHLASRLTIGAGVLPNTRGHLAGWIANSQAIKPGNYMPRNYLSGPELQALVTYLQTLR